MNVNLRIEHLSEEVYINGDKDVHDIHVLLAGVI
jgi:hypothetical protein